MHKSRPRPASVLSASTLKLEEAGSSSLPMAQSTVPILVSDAGYPSFELFDDDLGFIAGNLNVLGCSEDQPEKKSIPSGLKTLTAQNEV
jgi:hypothetical protein